MAARHAAPSDLTCANGSHAPVLDVDTRLRTSLGLKARDRLRRKVTAVLGEARANLVRDNSRLCSFLYRAGGLPHGRQ
jgi:hypothetical protein